MNVQKEVNQLIKQNEKEMNSQLTKFLTKLTLNQHEKDTNDLLINSDDTELQNQETWN